MSTVTQANDRIVCHCLRITKSQVQEAARLRSCETVRDVINQTTAGTGCTACHGALKSLLERNGEQDQ